EWRGDRIATLSARRDIRPERGEVLRLGPGLAERPPQLELVDRANPPELLIADDPAAAHLGVDDPLEVRAERAVVVDPDRARDEDAIGPVELLLAVESERVVRHEIAVRVHGRRGGNRRDARSGKLQR